MDNVAVWEKTRLILAENLSPTLLKLCFTKTAVLSVVKNGTKLKVAVGCPNNFLREQIGKKCGGFLVLALEKVLQDNVELELKVVSGGKLITQEDLSRNINNDSYNLNGRGKNLSPYTFENFVVGESNKLAYSAASAVCANPGSLYNPLFIYGGTGLGKTHLLQAIATRLEQAGPALKVCYKTTEAFINEFVEALATGSIRAFREKYRRLGVLLIDDVHFLSGKPSTQDEFFHTFNELYSVRNQVVLTSDRHPTEIGKLTDRLVSRFLGGLTVDIAPPELELKMAIATKKAAAVNLVLEDGVCQFIAENTSNTREVEGAIAALTQSGGFGTTPGLSIVKELFSKKIQPQAKATPKQIITAVSKFYSLKTTEVAGVSRKKEFVRARQMVMFLLRKELGLSYDFIGKILGGKDHSTVIHGFEAFTAGLEKNPNLKEDLLEVKRSYNF